MSDDTALHALAERVARLEGRMDARAGKTGPPVANPAIVLAEIRALRSDVRAMMAHLGMEPKT